MSTPHGLEYLVRGYREIPWLFQEKLFINIDSAVAFGLKTFTANPPLKGAGV